MCALRLSQFGHNWNLPSYAAEATRIEGASLVAAAVALTAPAALREVLQALRPCISCARLFLPLRGILLFIPLLIFSLSL